MTITSPFVPAVTRFLVGLAVVTVSGLLIVGGSTYVTAVTEARQAQRRVCAAELRALKAKSALVARMFHAEDPCRAMAILAKETSK